MAGATMDVQRRIFICQPFSQNFHKNFTTLDPGQKSQNRGSIAHSAKTNYKLNAPRPGERARETGIQKVVSLILKVKLAGNMSIAFSRKVNAY